MANKFQKIIYVVSAFAPAIILFDIVWWYQTVFRDVTTKTNIPTVPQIPIAAVAIVSIILLSISFHYGRGHLKVSSIKVDSFSPNDMWVIVYIVTYILPLASTVFKDFNLEILAGIIIALLIITILADIKLPNPLLMLARYHFYTVGINDASSDYVLISRRKLVGPGSIHYVKQYFGFILIDAEK